MRCRIVPTHPTRRHTEATASYGSSVEPTGYPTPIWSCPVQVIIYYPGQPTIVEGTATAYPNQPVDLQLPIATPPPVGLPIQIILYGPTAPTVYEGTTGVPNSDGTFPISITPPAA